MIKQWCNSLFGFVFVLWLMAMAAVATVQWFSHPQPVQAQGVMRVPFTITTPGVPPACPAGTTQLLTNQNTGVGLTTATGVTTSGVTATDSTTTTDAVVTVVTGLSTTATPWQYRVCSIP